MEACTALMRNLGQRYVQHFNKAYDRTGTLWEGRYRSCVAESARYVLACYRYIELNPVRAGMVSHAASYPWSSHRGNIGNLADSLLSPHPEFLALGSTAESRIACYVRLVEETLDATALKDIRAATNGGYPLGSEAFKTDVAGLGHKIAPGRAGRPTKKLADPDPSSLEIGL